jgi:hypothetical protein
LIRVARSCFIIIFVFDKSKVLGIRFNRIIRLVIDPNVLIAKLRCAGEGSIWVVMVGNV